MSEKKSTEAAEDIRSLARIADMGSPLRDLVEVGDAITWGGLDSNVGGESGLGHISPFGREDDGQYMILVWVDEVGKQSTVVVPMIVLKCAVQRWGHL